MECGTLRYCFYVPLYPTIMPAPAVAPMLGAGARLASMAGRMGSVAGRMGGAVGQVAQKVAPHLDKVQTVRGAMDPAMKKLKEKQQERAQKEAMERQRMAETQNRQQMVADTSGSTTTGFDY
tara:strand:+ start:81 stop:446 length:366 start_codon:yes stop_codon:yes gene_type:complete